MVDKYFSEREQGSPQRTKEEISLPVWGGIVAIVESLVANGAFGAAFPEECPDGYGTSGTDRRSMALMVKAEIPELPWPLDSDEVPSGIIILDFVEFCHDRVAEPHQGGYHDFFRHYHLSFNREAGQSQFREQINRLFSRNGLAFELTEDGKIRRLAPPVLSEPLEQTIFRTGDTILDSMLEIARQKFLDPDPNVRSEALEKLWDAWERLKTLEAMGNKKRSIQELLDMAAPEINFRNLLEAEARELTRIGNKFHIRHSETTQTPIHSDFHVDYLFHRLFAIIQLLLRARSPH